MQFVVLTIFPEMFDAFWGHGIIRRAVEGGRIFAETVCIRDFAPGRHRQTAPIPAGALPFLHGVDMRPQAILKARREAQRDPQGPIEEALGRVMDSTGLTFGKIAQPLRVALTGGTVSPSICLVMAVMGKETALKRIGRAAGLLA